MSMMNQKLARVMRAQQALGYLGVGRVQPRPFESSRVSDQNRFEDHPAPTEDDMISKLVILKWEKKKFSKENHNPLSQSDQLIFLYRGALLEASSPLWVPRPRRIPRRQLSPLAAWTRRLLEHRELSRADLSLGDGFKVEPRLLPHFPLLLVLLLRQSVQRAPQAEESEEQHHWRLLIRLTLRTIFKQLEMYMCMYACVYFYTTIYLSLFKVNNYLHIKNL